MSKKSGYSIGNLLDEKLILVLFFTVAAKLFKVKSPVFEDLYLRVAAGEEAQRSIDTNSQPDYREKLEAELKELRESEMWQAGKVVRSLRPKK